MNKSHLTILSLGLCLGMAGVACSSSEGDDGEGGSGGESSGGKGGGGGSKSGGKGGGAPSGPGKQLPEGDDVEAWESFLEDGEYQKGGWVSDVAAPRKQRAPSIHGDVRVFFNEKMKDSHATYPATYEKDSALVKEFFKDGESVGWVAFRKVGEGQDEYEDWQVFCSGPKSRCAAGEGDDKVTFAGSLKEHMECQGCHHKGSNPDKGKLIYTRAPR